MKGLCIRANLCKVELIDSMIVVDPQRRFTVEQCLEHPWLTELAPGQQPLAEQASVLRRIPTWLVSDNEVPLSTCVTSSEESERTKAGPSLENTESKKSETEDKSDFQ